MYRKNFKLMTLLDKEPNNLTLNCICFTISYHHPY